MVMTPTRLRRGALPCVGSNVKAANEDDYQDPHRPRPSPPRRIKSMLSPPQAYSEQAISRLRERIGELNLTLQHSK